jgi:predicted phosphodiesterase
MILILLFRDKLSLHAIMCHSSAFQNKYKTPVYKLNQPDDSYKFRPLPKPTGKYPYHFSVNQIIDDVSDDKMVFHIVGDTGSVRNPSFQKLVVAQMLRHFKENGSELDDPQFLYHLGDVVYNFGEASAYQSQFFTPYAKYPAPIIAIAGNHDSEVNPESAPYNSLDAFTAVFCAPERGIIPFSGNASRLSMNQPNVYWTLETPLATFIGLHSNTPKFGIITEEQRAWFREELLAAGKLRPEKALIVCIHHSAYSADINHGSSIPMIEFLEGAFMETGVRPDVVFSGHVHNYQRFEKHYADGGKVLYVVCGGGGYDELHPIAALDDDRFNNDNPLFAGVELLNYCDNKHGFLKVSIERTVAGITIGGEYYSIPHEEEVDSDDTAALSDTFKLELNA